MPEISVITVNYNGCHLLGECLDSLRRQRFKDFEVILVDNASQDGSVEFVKENYPEVLVVKSSKNLGFGSGNNLGIEIAKGQFIALLNNDAVADENWLMALWRASQQAPHDVGMYACKILNYYDHRIIDSAGLLMYPDGVARGRGRLEEDRGQYAIQEEVFIPSGCAALYRKEMLDEIGLFDEDFFLYLDDVDIGLRARLSGWKCIYVPDAIVYHRYSATSSPYSPMKAYYVERNRIWILIKYFPLRMIMMSSFYTSLRYLFQVYGALAGKGAVNKLTKSESIFNTIKIVLRAYLSAFKMSGKMLRKRREIRRFKRVNNSEFYEWFKNYRISTRELAFKD